MSRTALALVIVAASTSAASAGGFVGLGVGTSPATSGDLGLEEDGRSVRLQVGYQFGLSVGQISIEGFGSKADLYRNDGAAMDWTTLAVAGRYNLPLGDRFEVFGRLGLQHSSVEQENFDDSFAGSGFLVGAGVEYRLPLAAVGASLFIDYNIEHATLDSPTRPGSEFDLTARVWTLGANLYF